MNNYLLNMTRRILLVWMFLFCAIAGWTQVYQNGIRKGQIKVKFTSSMTNTLGQMKVSARSSGLTTGIQKFDAAAKKASATNMYRLFPANAQNENKLHKHGLDLWYVVEIKDNVDPKLAIEQFKQLAEITAVEVEHERVLAPFSVTPYAQGASPSAALPFNDPLLKDQWHYNNTGQTGFGDADINLFEAWKVTAGASNIIVSIHDQGVDVKHADLKNNIWVNQVELTGKPNVDDDHNGYVDDVNGYDFQHDKGAVDAEFHGTHVAGTIAAVNNNGIGVSGVAGGSGKADGVKIMSLEIFGGLFENSYIYAADNGAVISQNSWGYNNPFVFDQSVKEAIDYFVAEAGTYPGSPMKGGLVIFAAGNSNSDSEWYPGYFSNVMSVAALGPEWKRAYYSNFGNWVEIAAPGGDQNYNSKSGVLSTVPKDQYAYLQGTSMACPHMSGIAALALANRKKQLTNTELWNKLVTGIVNIDQYNPDYIGNLGSGAVDAALAIKNDMGIAPVAIANLNVTGITQEFATLSWKVPADNDDGKPTAFQLYYATQPITSTNLSSATKVTIKNEKAIGENYTHEVDGLLGITTYYFAITSTDRWGNVSLLSNVVSDKTNEGPSIAVDDNSKAIDLEINAVVGNSASHDITILNNAAGVLRWNHFMRNKSSELSYNAAGINYPTVRTKKTGADLHLAKRTASDNKNKLRSSEPTPSSFTEIEKSYTGWTTDIIGETDTSLTNSAAAKFYVTEADGFNLTQVRMYLKHDPKKGPVIVEVYKGETPSKVNLMFAQEYSNYDTEETLAYITLNEQLYFESGEIFWVVFHVPSGNLYPLGIGFEEDPSYSKNCFISFNLGTSWIPLEQAINNKDFAWSVVAASQNAALGTFLTLEPGSGDVVGEGNTMTTLSADGSTLINGTYSSNLVLTSNDVNHKELRVPVNLTVTGHLPDIKHIDIADFGNVFVGIEKTLEFVLDNQGFGNFNDPVFSLGGSDFEIVGYAPWQLKAREEVTVKIKFMPTTVGSINDVLTITNGTQTYEIPLVGIGAETSKIVLDPETQIVNDITIGDEVTAIVTVKNNGAYPLKYFIPGFDSKGVSNNWPSKYHTYGYKVRSNKSTETNPIPYEFQDIKSTGLDITSELNTEFKYFTIDMGFDFPYYGKKMQKLYVAQKGFTTFDNTVNPINIPSLNNPYNPRGFISPLGSFFSYLTQGQIFYQIEADRVIVQFENVWDGYNEGSITAQMVLFANGDIRFFYDNMGFSEDNQQGLTILIEDLDQKDGILVHNWAKPTELYSGLAIGFDYPGPNIITNVENGSGIITPGNSTIVNITMTTSSLAEGVVNRYINFISNDPSKAQTNVLVQLNITGGGISKSTVSTDTIAFGNVFQGANKSSVFVIKNTGTASVDISNMTFVNNDFTVVGDQPTSIKPGLYKNYKVQVPTSTLATLNDWLSINYADGSHDTVYITAKVIDAPVIQVDLSLLQQTLTYGDSIRIPFAIENTGLGTLEVSTTGKQWLSFDAPAAPQSVTYTYEKQNIGGVYQWIDIRKTGTQLPFMDADIETSFWRTLVLPFPIEFYGVKYDSFKIGDNGIISFEVDPQASFFTDKIPATSHLGACIMPYWTFSGFSDYIYSKEDIGIFYQFYDDKIIITWSYFTNNFGGMGDPVSAQIIFYKNGTMKFQYKAEESGADFTSQFSAIGLQKDSSTGVYISDHLPLDYGKGLAYVILPGKKFSIAPNSTLNGQVNIDSRNVYGGVYSDILKIQTNVPNSENLEKPVELTVTGDAMFTAADTVDFGNKMITFDLGSPTVKSVDLKFTNEGAAPYEITWSKMADGMQGLSLQIYMLADGWFGPEWRWVDISEAYSPLAFTTPTFSLMPGDELKAHAIFYPSEPGDFTDELVMTTSIGEQRIVLKGTGVEPPVLKVDKTPIKVMLNTAAETADKTIAFDNIDGKSDLEYAISINYRRVAAATTAAMSANQETMAMGVSKSTLSATKVSVQSGARTQAIYNRTLSHTTSQAPNTFIGNGGSAEITLATKYNAGPNGFLLSHVENWFRHETLKTGTISVEIRAGGTSIANAVTLSQGKINFKGSKQDDAGKWYQIKMDKPAAIYPNEDFYVTVTYPFGIAYPQGAITDSETVRGRYYYYDEGAWGDIQKINGMENIGWLMFAAEETAGNTSWLSVTSSTEGALSKGESSTVNLHFNGAITLPGDQLANVVFASNDPVSDTVIVPVKLHMNEGPHFNGALKNIILAEKDTVTLNFNVVDTEGHTFTLAPAETYKGVNFTFTNGQLTIALTPDYDDAGNHTYIFKGTDQIGAVSELALSVEVMNMNRTPEYIAVNETKTLEYNSIGRLIEYPLGDFFADPDQDEVSFNVVSGDIGVADVFVSTNQFIVRPMAMGKTMLIFTITDSKGAVLSDTLKIKVNNILGVEEEANGGLKVYPNPVQQFAKVLLSYEWKGLLKLEVIDATGKQHLVQEVDVSTSHDIQLNVSSLRKGFYVLHAASADKRISVKLIKE